MSIKNLNIGKKIYLVAMALILIFTLSLSWLYSSYRDQLFAGRQNQLITAVDTAWGIIDHFSKAAEAGMPIDEAQQLAKAAVKNLRFEGDIYFWINDTQPKMIMHPVKPALDGQNLSESKDPDGLRLFVEMVNVANAKGAGFVEYKWPKPGKEKPQQKLSYVKKHSDWNWIIGSGMYVDDLQAEINTVFYQVIGVLLLAILISIGLVFFLARGVSRPMHKAVLMVEEMAKGHLQLRMDMNQNDEVGRMARAMDSFADSLQKEIIVALKKLASGDLNFEITPYDAEDEIRGALKKLEIDLNATMQEIQLAGENIAGGSNQVNDSAQTLSSGATESAASLEEISSSLAELASQTRQNSENASMVNQLSSDAKQAADQGNNQMQRMVGAMDEINLAGQNISKIIKVIDEIAFQTNLLALNAAVEAARAGQHGKGFAVVAEEVRNLAARSAKAAQETAELIEGSVQKTSNGATIAKQTADSLKEILLGVTKVSDLAGEIAAASEEQSQGISQVSQGVGQIDQVTQQNTACAEESAASAEQLADQASQLQQMLRRFQLKGGRSQAAFQQAERPSRQPQRPRPQPKLSQGWGQTAQPQRSAAKQVIALDDSEFGKF
ncbi:MAG TPA: methyl-accepting chemotaxis protein [Malonomonas sp.]